MFIISLNYQERYNQLGIQYTRQVHSSVARYYFRSTESGIIVMYCLLIHNSYFSLSLHYERIFYPPKFSNDNLHSSDLSVSDADKCGLR